MEDVRGVGGRRNGEGEVVGEKGGESGAWVGGGGVERGGRGGGGKGARRGGSPKTEHTMHSIVLLLVFLIFLCCGKIATEARAWKRNMVRFDEKGS